jgi:DMSO/TMAO reductase YedYZ molybdopterin-dependent catalytic subunit
MASTSPPAANHGISRTDGLVAGAIAGAAALAAGELVAAIAQQPSLVGTVADTVIEFAPPFVAETAIDALGTNDKPALIIGTVVLSVLFGALLGRASRSAITPAAAGFTAFGLFGIWSAVRHPLTDATPMILAGLTAIIAGVGTLALLLNKAVERTHSYGAAAGVAGDPTAVGASPTPAPDLRTMAAMSMQQTSGAPRRRFLAWAGGAAAVTAGTAAIGRGLAGNQSVEGARAAIELPTAINAVPDSTVATTVPPATPVADCAPTVGAAGNFDTVQGVSTLITPNDDFYLIDEAIVKPQIDPNDWSLTVDGMVDNPYTLSFDELLAMDTIEETITLSCVSNSVGGSLVGNAVWQGVPLADILERAGVQDGAEQVVSRSIDKWNCGFPLEVALDGRPAMVAVAMNGEPLPVAHGFPARLVVPGLYGYVSATKWLVNISLDTWEGFNGYWVERRWAKEGPIKTQSRIDVPGRNTSAGTQMIAGVAWAGERGIDKVEVSIDGGEWQECELSEELARTSWRQWKLEWDPAPGVYTVACRATDGSCETQTEERVDKFPDGATGHHTRTVEVSA